MNTYNDEMMEEEHFDDKSYADRPSSEDDGCTAEEECFLEGYDAADEDEFYDEKEEEEEDD